MRSLEIQGFKSFPDKVTLTFEEGITAVVGPNGSGKSNIADAIRWVLGEQSTRALRGGKMEDVIFGGGGGRRRQGFAQVTLTLDNEGGQFPVEEPQVGVTRRYYRSGESEYYINRRPVRLRDVHELFRDTGLGQEGYSLISQGKIDEILSVKGERRREVFEEAAGISRFRHRKEEAQRKLERTQENLRRIMDKLEELALQVEPLQAQAEKARQYLLWRDELRTLEISLWMHRLEGLREKLAGMQEAFAQAKDALEEGRALSQSLYDRAEELRENLAGLEGRAEGLRRQMTQVEEERGRAQAAVAGLEARIANNRASARETTQDVAVEDARTADLATRMDQRQGRLKELEELLARCREEVRQGEELAAREGDDGVIREASEALAELRAKENALQASLREGQMENRALGDRIQLLSEMERMYEGYGKAVKVVMAEAGRGGLGGIHGPVAGLLTVPGPYTVAVETALGGAMGHLVVDREEDGKAVFAYLKRRDAGRVTCLPLSAIRGSTLQERELESQPGFVGIASSLVSFEAAYEKVIANLLGRVVVVEQLDAAIAIARRFGHRFRIVTLDGQVLNPGGSMTGGTASRTGGMLSRAGELAALREKRQALAARLSQWEGAWQKAREATLQGERTLEEARKGAEDRRTALLQRLHEARLRLTGLEAERGQSREALEELTQLRDSLHRDFAQRRRRAALLEEETARLEEELAASRQTLARLQSKAQTGQEELARASREKLALEGERTQADRAAREQNDRLLRLQQEAAVWEQKTMAAALEEEQLLTKMWETYEVTHQKAESIRVPLDSPAAAQKQAQKLRGSIQRLGSVNLGAVEEYERVRERVDFLTGQQEDVERAKAGIEEIIEEITGQMQTIFREQFAALDRAFGETFSQLFPGGTGALALDDPQDVLGCGIEIEAKLPGKSLRVLSLLSGGEKAFVSIALYFAMLKVRPTPFCVMDEIEAALDDANVERFATYLRGMSGKTQFIVITHRRGTMEEADVLYGVTMEEQGVSRLLRLSLAEAEETLQGT